MKHSVRRKPCPLIFQNGSSFKSRCRGFPGQDGQDGEGPYQKYELEPPCLEVHRQS